jgi:hypothetical protein
MWGLKVTHLTHLPQSNFAWGLTCTCTSGTVCLNVCSEYRQPETLAPTPAAAVRLLTVQLPADVTATLVPSAEQMEATGTACGLLYVCFVHESLGWLSTAMLYLYCYEAH